MEGVAKMIARMMREEFKKSIFSKMAGLIAWPVLARFKNRADPRKYNGASMLGLNGIVIKSHGSADVVSYANAIKIAILEVEKSVPEHIRECMAPLLKQAAKDSDVDQKEIGNKVVDNKKAKDEQIDNEQASEKVT